MDFERIREYWEERASSDTSAQSTTQDFYLREIEFRTLSEWIARLIPAKVLDVGCGDGRTTLRLAMEFPTLDFQGLDYSAAMVKNACGNIAEAGAKNIRIQTGDITRPLETGPVDVAYTTRCLINLPSWDLQMLALENIHRCLIPGGYYVMVENFLEGQENFNRVRATFGLPEIPVRSHNLFFERSKLSAYVSTMFDVEGEANISSTYYLVSRVIYSKICKEKSLTPDYFDDHHKYASGLPFAGDFGPVRMICMRKKG